MSLLNGFLSLGMLSFEVVESAIPRFSRSSFCIMPLHRELLEILNSNSLLIAQTQVVALGVGVHWFTGPALVSMAIVE